MTDQSVSVLTAWQSIEVLTPHTFNTPKEFARGKDDKIIFIDTAPLPWHTARRPLQDGEKYFYHLVFTTSKLSTLYEKLTDAFTGQPAVNSAAQKDATIAVITIDENGCVGPANQIAISSFAWAYPIVLKHQFDKIAHWHQHESELQVELHKLLTCDNSIDNQSNNFAARDDTIISLTKASILHACKLVIEKLEINLEDWEPTYFLVQKIVNLKFNNTPALPLLNSFFIDELNDTKILAADSKINPALRLYLQTKKIVEYTDIIRDVAYLKDLLAPRNMPFGRWPTGQNSLVLLQQAIVNAVCHKDKPHHLLAVNGPPGTGKTTIIRDIIADLVVKRAEIMVEYNNPEDAFHYKRDVRVYADTQKFYTLDTKLTGFEILIASSNNNAVENISKELSNIDAIASDIPAFDYFKATSDAINTAGRQSTHIQHDFGPANDDSQSNTWGLIAAVLGNKNNKNKFRYAFWGHDNTSVKSYLETAMGSLTEPSKQPYDSSDHRPLANGNAKLVQPYNKIEALDQWHQAVHIFQQAIRKVQQQLGILENARHILDFIDDFKQQHHQFLDSVKNIDHDILSAIENENTIQDVVNQQILKSAEATTHLYKQKIDQPPFWHRITKRTDWKQWQARFQELRQIDQQISLQLTEFTAQHQTLISELSALKNTADSVSAKIIAFDEKMANFEFDLHHARSLAADHFADGALWARERQTLHKSIVWLSAEIQRERDHVFAAALGVHKAFIGAAANPLYCNLNILMGLFANCRSIDLDDDDMADVWRNLFLITPIASTTFSSVRQMFGNLPSESLGWLIVDEAGQSPPQAVVGAMQRCQRTIILGDPMQLEPIRPLPDKLLDAICRLHDIDPKKWSPACTSIQSCADAVSQLGTYRGQAHQQNWVGLPLLVHRRCATPMFEIANKIAYDNTMIHATAVRSSAIENFLGSSCWFDIDSNSEDKWSMTEGHFVIDIIESLLNTVDDKPDIYILSPFKTVVTQMQNLFKETISKPRKFTHEKQQWFLDRIGTIHTFQGKEAEAVIFLLGAPAPDESKSRDWAGQSPNLLNVAVTRAKCILYVIGNHQAWHQKGVFQSLAAKLSVRNTKYLYRNIYGV